MADFLSNNGLPPEFARALRKPSPPQDSARMWCSQCQQDVPAVARTSQGPLVCSCCGQIVKLSTLERDRRFWHRAGKSFEAASATSGLRSKPHRLCGAGRSPRETSSNWSANYDLLTGRFSKPAACDGRGKSPLSPLEFRANRSPPTSANSQTVTA